ncbi:NAD(P)-binding protein [Abortiporus biennis]|nr:NAD(P)-binding protein [Abortiporus biennis]
MSANDSKRILVFGATGAQGLAVIDALLAPSDDGSPSPYTIRAFTRDINSRRSLELTARGVECVQGNTDDELSILAALRNVYGVWTNLDSFALGQQKEIYTGIRIFELAKQVRTVRHYVWSGLDYAFKKGNYNPAYNCDHLNGKAKVTDWMRAQPSNPTDNDMSWSVVTTTPYMDTLKIHMFGPVNRRADGTFVFATPARNARIPMIALSDLGYFARYTFDHRQETSGQELETVSDMVSCDHLVSTFTKVTGQKAVVLHQTMDEWMANLVNVDRPLVNGLAQDSSLGHGITWRQNFTAFWALFRDGIVQRDLDWLRSIHPKIHTLESWMRETNYNGELEVLLKDQEDHTILKFNSDRVAQL